MEVVFADCEYGDLQISDAEITDNYRGFDQTETRREVLRLS